MKLFKRDNVPFEIQTAYKWYCKYCKYSVLSGGHSVLYQVAREHLYQKHLDSPDAKLAKAHGKTKVVRPQTKGGTE